MQTLQHFKTSKYCLGMLEGCLLQPVTKFFSRVAFRQLQGNWSGHGLSLRLVRLNLHESVTRNAIVRPLPFPLYFDAVLGRGMTETVVYAR